MENNKKKVVEMSKEEKRLENLRCIDKKIVCLKRRIGILSEQAEDLREK